MKKRASNNIFDMCFALEKVYRPKGTFFEELCIEKEPSIRSEHFTVGIFAMLICYRCTCIVRHDV